jgi:sulfur-oxidizing protein SoxY
MHQRKSHSRREILGGIAGAALASVVRLEPASATPASMKAAIRNVVGEAEVKKGKVQLDIPALVENGNAVSLVVQVESPMTDADHVKAIHVFNELNPQPNVISAYFGSRAGVAKIATRFRLADTQTVVAIAQMSDGSFWSTSADVVVTIPACLEQL